MEAAIEVMTSPRAFYGYRCQGRDAALAGNCNTSPGAFINDKQNAVKKLEGIFNVVTNSQFPFGRGKTD
jgi:hypothetical protein